MPQRHTKVTGLAYNLVGSTRRYRNQGGVSPVSTAIIRKDVLECTARRFGVMESREEEHLVMARTQVKC